MSRHQLRTAHSGPHAIDTRDSVPCRFAQVPVRIDIIRLHSEKQHTLPLQSCQPILQGLPGEVTPNRDMVARPANGGTYGATRRSRNGQYSFRQARILSRMRAVTDQSPVATAPSIRSAVTIWKDKPVTTPRHPTVRYHRPIYTGPRKSNPCLTTGKAQAIALLVMTCTICTRAVTSSRRAICI